MSFMSQIGINLEQLAQNVARMQEQATTMPPAAQVSKVDGADTEAAQQRYRYELRLVAAEVAILTRQVRAYVERNAAAFESAAAALQETDGADSLAARQADAFVQAIVAPPTKSTGPSPSAPASTPSSQPAPGATAW
jgi:hypothetical protein